MKINSGTMEYIKTQIQYVCETFKGRSAGSPAERQCQMHFKSELLQWADSVMAENFSLSPNALLGWLIPAALLNIFSVFCLWLGAMYAIFYIIGALCTTVSLTMLLFEFILYKKLVDFAFPKAESVNVFAARKPLGETRKRIIFGGHADAAYEMRLFLDSHHNVFAYIPVAGAVGGMVCVWVFNLLALFTPATAVYSTVGALFIPFFITMMFFINKSIVVDGANDNLSGCLAAMGVLREMHLNGLRLENTEVCCLITGGEESGLRGAEVFAKAHRREFQDIETIFIALDTLHEMNQLMVYTRGINGMQKNSPKAVKLLTDAARDTGMELRLAGIYPGAMDSEAFSREGLFACGLAGVDHIPQPYYHTRHDTCANIGETCIQSALEICMAVALRYDQSSAATAQDLTDAI